MTLDGFIPGSMSILYYVSPDGVVLHLTGGREGGEHGFRLGDGPDGLGHIDVETIFDPSPRGIGEHYLGATFPHGKIDLPIHVYGANPDQARRRREWLRELIQRDRQGWLCAYTNASGWRFVAVRRGSIKPAYTRDPAGTNGATLDVLLIADSPFARAADGDVPEWTNIAGKTDVSGSLSLYPGPEVEAWPAFVFTGPGVLRLVYAGNDVTLPEVLAGEYVLIDTTNGAQTLRARKVGSSERGRNLWPLMRGAGFEFPIPPATVTRAAFTIRKASRASKLWATVPRWQEGLL
jgi:hypothetical protein